VIESLGNFIGGRWTKPARGRRLVSEDPGDLDRPVGRFVSDPSAVEKAVAAARAAFAAWREKSLSERVVLVRRYRDELLKRKDELADVISRETGKPLAESAAEVKAMAEKVDVTENEALPLVAERAFAMDGASRGVVRRRPRGVTAVIGPFNVPGHLPNGQAVPALLTGNTVVFKPSELTPFTGQLMAECFRAAGLPDGVFNLVQGDGAAGGRLAAHPGVDTVFFTGSVATGERVRSACAAQPGKLVALELGGKNAALVLDDAPLEQAVKETLHGAFSTSGQRCSSTSRILVHRSVAKDFVDAFLARVDALKVGYYTEEPFLGPLISEASAERFLAAQKTARKLGFKALREGRRLPASRRGHYVGPSVHVWEKRTFPWEGKTARGYWDEELFAPDVAVYALDSDEAMAAANNASRYGLVAGVFTRSQERFARLAARLENGVVHWNRTTAMTPGRLPFGGVKASGNHWPAGLHVVYACTTPVGSVETPPS
jgi:succinylglutamic semialdehyde dehydrogenase